MNKNVLPIIGLVIIGGIVGFFLMQRSAPDSTMMKKDDTTMLKDDSTTPEDSMMKPSGEAMPEDDSVMEKPGSYIPYSAQAYADASNQKRVLFFHATWCPTCKTANEEFTSKIQEIPSNVVILKTDYDKESELKRKYGITYQHTFVQVDEQGNEITKWSGGDIQELKNNLL